MVAKCTPLQFQDICAVADVCGNDTAIDDCSLKNSDVRGIPCVDTSPHNVCIVLVNLRDITQLYTAYQSAKHNATLSGATRRCRPERH